MSLLDKIPLFARANKLVRANILHNSSDTDELLKEIRKEPAIDVTNVKDANLITSEIAPGFHLPLLDLDMKAGLVESSTPGHYHLYIDKPMKWDKYLKFLEAARDAGIIQEGFYKGAKERGYSSLRMPHIKKHDLKDNLIDYDAYQAKLKGQEQASTPKMPAYDPWVFEDLLVGKETPPPATTTAAIVNKLIVNPANNSADASLISNNTITNKKTDFTTICNYLDSAGKVTMRFKEGNVSIFSLQGFSLKNVNGVPKYYKSNYSDQWVPVSDHITELEIEYGEPQKDLDW